MLKYDKLPNDVQDSGEKINDLSDFMKSSQIYKAACKLQTRLFLLGQT